MFFCLLTLMSCAFWSSAEEIPECPYICIQSVTQQRQLCQTCPDPIIDNTVPYKGATAVTSKRQIYTNADDVSKKQNSRILELIMSRTTKDHSMDLPLTKQQLQSLEKHALYDYYLHYA